MGIQFPSDSGHAYGRAHAWQEAPLRARQASQISSAREIQAGGDKVSEITGKKECQTCKSRKYVDVSGDSTVSFQTPTTLSPQAAEVAVRAHEQQHVVHEQASAGEEGRKVVFQQVSIHYSICPECGRMFVSGGTTRTVTKAAEATGYSEPPKSGAGVGMLVDTRM